MRFIPTFMKRVGLVSSAVLCGALGLAGQQAPGPTFRSGVDVVHVDVSVLDKDRKPVRGLTAADFTVLEDGKPRPIVAFTAVDLPEAPTASASPAAAAWTREVAPDVTTNAVPEEGRLVVILLDWSIRFEDQALARKIATAAVNHLGSGDEAAVVFTSGFANAGTPQGFTADRARLLEAINRPFAVAMHEPNTHDSDPRRANEVMLHDPEGYEVGDCHCRVCVLDAVTHIADMLRDVPGRRKMLLFIGTFFQGYEYQLPIRPQLPTPGAVPVVPSDAPVTKRYNQGTCTGPLQEAREKMQRATGLSNLTVHVLDPGGVETGGDSPLGGGALVLEGQQILSSQAVIAKGQDDLHIMPDMTGGRTVLNTNAPEELVPAIFQESQSYYLVGFERGASTTDGKAHKVDIKVKRSNVSVRFRNGYLATEALAAVHASPASIPIGKSLDGVLPRADLPLTVTTVPFATPGAATPSTLAIIVGVREPAPTGDAGPAARTSETETVLAAAFDTKGQSVGKVQQTVHVDLPPASGRDVNYEVLSQLPSKPGRYEIRVAVDIAPNRRGTVYTFVDVPDFAKDALSLSGLAVDVKPPIAAASADLFKALLPVVPTARRVFSRADHVRAFARVYQGGSGALAPVSLTARVLRVDDRAVFDETSTLPVVRFDSHRAADYGVDVPLSRLEPGDYLLTIDAKEGAHAVRRDLRFTVSAQVASH